MLNHGAAANKDCSRLVTPPVPCRACSSLNSVGVYTARPVNAQNRGERFELNGSFVWLLGAASLPASSSQPPQLRLCERSTNAGCAVLCCWLDSMAAGSCSRPRQPQAAASSSDEIVPLVRPTPLPPAAYAGPTDTRRQKRWSAHHTSSLHCPPTALSHAVGSIRSYLII